MRSYSEQISLEKDYEVRHWMRALRWTQLELYTGVQLVGKGLVDLQRLRAMKSTPPGGAAPVPLHSLHSPQLPHRLH